MYKTEILYCLKRCRVNRSIIVSLIKDDSKWGVGEAVTTGKRIRNSCTVLYRWALESWTHCRHTGDPPWRPTSMTPESCCPAQTLKVSQSMTPLEANPLGINTIELCNTVTLCLGNFNLVPDNQRRVIQGHKDIWLKVTFTWDTGFLWNTSTEVRPVGLTERSWRRVFYFQGNDSSSDIAHSKHPHPFLA